MEKVKVVKAIPGLLNVGDVLISPEPGCDFNLEETTKVGNYTSDRYVSLDYTTVSANIPEFFEFDLSDYLTPEVGVMKTDAEIGERYQFFQEQMDDAYPGSEQKVVFQNLMWFIEWLYGYKELI